MSAYPPPPGYTGDPPGGFGPGVPQQADAQRLVKPPAIALMVFAGLNLIEGLLFLVVGVVSIVNPGALNSGRGSGLESAFNTGVALGLALLIMLGSVTVFFGAMQMMKLHSWGIALAATIVAMVPVFSFYCCPLGLGFGIWALVILVKPEVKAAFS